MRLGGADYPSRPPEQWPAHAPWGGPPPLGSPAPPPAPPSDGGPGRGWPVVVTAVVVVVALALAIAGVGTLVSSSDDGDEATSTTIDLSDPAITAPPSEEPIAPSMPEMPSIPGFDPGGGVDPEEQARPLAEVLPELIAFVEETRGLEFLTDPVVEAVPDDEFEALLADAQAEDGGELAESEVTGIGLDLLPPGFDLAEATASLGAVSVLGFYQPETKELYVKGDVVTPFVQAIIVHELTHALDDQHFDLGRLDALADQGDEGAFGFLALVEGSASHVMTAFESTFTTEELAAYEAEQLELGFEQMPLALDLPPSVLVTGQVPYASGERFVDDLVDDGGMDALDAAYAAPPTTSEQILDPDVYRAAEPSVPLRPLEAPAGVEVVQEVAFGAADLRILEVVVDPMSALLDPEMGLLEPVPGFGGGQLVSWTDAGESCVALEAVGDDAAGSATIRDLLDEWAAAAGGATVSTRPGSGGIEVVQATRCA